jgi:hypothetical protein
MATILSGLWGCRGSKSEEPSAESPPETSAAIQLENKPTPIPITRSPPEDPLPRLIETIQSRGGKVSVDETGVTAIDWHRAPINNLDLELLTEVPTLKRLYLPGVRIDSRGWMYLSTLPNLERLSLWKTPVTDDDLKFLAGAKKLEVLDLSQTRITGEGLVHLADCQRLDTLILKNTALQVQTVPHLAKLQSLRVLDIWGTQVQATAIAPLKALPNLEELRMLFFPDSLPQLAELPNIRRLTLSRFAFQAPMRHLDSLSRMNRLESIVAEGAGVTPAFFHHVAKCPSLREIHLVDTPQVTDAALAPLSACPTLRLLDARNTKATAVGLRQIAQANPQLQILVHPIKLHGLQNAFESMHLGAKHSRDGGPRLVLDREMNITTLRLEDAKIFLPSLKLIAGAIDAEKLEHLGLGHTDLTDEGLANFRAGVNLKHLSLTGTKITTQGLKTWGGGSYPELPRLEFLDLSGCTLDDDCLAWIGTLDQLKSLRLKDVQGVTETGLASLSRLENLKQLEK